ncbi:unnamed protein product [Schistosoma curassoni]|uniref:CCHC-type domain-containing protein n=1 Tax=Schistosoma curassoni TaxID=6186 RepID=A0A183KCQ5_9TREM|nr:unnamed protein product [Schistosoma curassoni]
METEIKQLDIHSTSEAFEDYLERFEVWSLTKKDVISTKIVAYFLTLIRREAYSLLKTLEYPEKPISLPYATLKELLLNHVKCTRLESRERAKFHKMVRRNDQKVTEFILKLQKQAAKCNLSDQLHVKLRDRLISGINIPGLERELLRMPNCSFQGARTACINYEAVNELDIQSMKISNTSLSRHDEIRSQGQPNLPSFNSDSYSLVNMKGEIKFGKCLSCGKFHSRNSCAFRNTKCFNCGKIGHIQSLCKATVHLASNSTKSCDLNLNNSDVSSDHLSSSTISKVSKESSDDLLKDLIATCAKCCGAMKIQPINLQVQGDPVFLKRRIIPYGLREAVHKALNDLRAKGIIKPIQSSAWGTPIINSLSILTTIDTTFGLFKFNFLSFGLSCSPAIFQEVMNKVVSDLEGVEVYQDDLIVYGSDKVVHDERLIALLRRLIERNITVNPNTCSFCVSSFECLGYLADGNGLRPDMKRLDPLTNAPSPKYLTELRSLVGTLQYYSRFIPNFSCLANCLFNILISNSFKQCEDQESCLRSLHKFLQSDSVLRVYSTSVHSVLITDASPVSISSVLGQEGRPVICVSRKLTVTEQALKFICHPEKSLARSSAAMVQRWCIALSAYDYTIQYRSAKQIQHVGYISRQSLQDRPANTSDCLTLKTAIDFIAASTFNERGVDTFLLQYRNARHSVTKETPSNLLKGRILRSNMGCLESEEVKYYRGNDIQPSTGIVLKNVGKSMVRIPDINDLSTQNRHAYQIEFQEPGECVPISVVNSNANKHILDNTDSLSNTRQPEQTDVCRYVF